LFFPSSGKHSLCCVGLIRLCLGLRHTVYGIPKSHQECKLDFFSVMMMVASAIKLDANYNPSYMEYKRSFPNSRIFGLAYNGVQMKRNFLDQVKARMPFKGFNVKPFQELIEAMIDDFKLLQWDTNYASGVNYHDPYRGF